jgi:WD40 repeat protein
LANPAEYLTQRLSPDGRRIAASRSQLNGTHEIWILESSRGAAIRFAEADIAGLAAWSPDGQRFLVRAAVQQSQPLTLIVNWPALLKGSPGR